MPAAQLRALLGDFVAVESGAGESSIRAVAPLDDVREFVDSAMVGAPGVAEDVVKADVRKSIATNRGDGEFVGRMLSSPMST
jgi:hypothetical protein